MSVTDKEISSWLDAEPPPIVEEDDNDDELGAFLETKDEPLKEEAVPDEWYKPAIDIGAGATDAFLNLLDVPNDIYNWAAEKLGSEYRIPSTRDLGAQLKMGYAEGDEPDTGSYRAGEYTTLGLEFLAPVLKLGRVASTVANPTVAKGVAQQMAKPFTVSPKTAASVELASGVTSGYGAHYGEQEWGEVGEQIGGLVGIAPSIAAGTINKSANYIVKSIFPFTETGGRAKAGAIIRKLSESPTFTEEIKRQSTESLGRTKHTPARLSKEPYLIALEKALIHDDAKLSHTLRKIDDKNNALAKTALKELAGDGAIEDAIKSLGNRYTKLKTRLDLKVDSALANAKTAARKLSPINQRKAVNIEVRKQLDDSLKAARVDENKLWDSVDKTAIAPTEATKGAFLKELLSRELEDDPADIPGYLHTFLGRLDKKTGALKGGKYADTRHVGGLQQLRSRLLQTIRNEKAGETPNWNKVRILENIEEAMLSDMGNSSAARGLDEALQFSRELNKKFRGDIMSIILRNSRTGGSLAPELTLDSVGAGPKGAFYIKRILNASPESKANIEDVLKMDIVQRKVVSSDGVLNIQKAKDYMARNEQTMDIFPVLKDDMENAISLAEAHKYFDGSRTTRIKKAEKALGYSLSDKTNPGRFITKILASKNPEETMTRVVRQVNAEGKAGIKNDVIDTILNKAKISELGTDETFMLSGKKALGYWNDNKSTLSKALKPKEIERLERILNDLRLGDDPKNIPEDVAKAALVPSKTLLGYVVEVAAARTGAMFGRGTSGASLKTASQAANTARTIVENIDTGMAKKLLKDAIQDEDLYIELAENMSVMKDLKYQFNAIQSWMIAHAVSSLEEEQEINQ